MGTGKRRISTAVQLEAKAEGGPVPELELVLVQAELELVPGAPELEVERGPAVALERELVLVVVPELELERGPAAALERELVLVAVPEPELERGPAAAPQLETAPVVALELVQVVVALRTRSVTAAHRRGLVPVLTAEDLVAVAETTREPAAAEAVIAWEVAE
jgi:hypothetical protein